MKLVHINMLVKQDTARSLSLLFGVSSCLFIVATNCFKSSDFVSSSSCVKNGSIIQEIVEDEDSLENRGIIVSVFPSSYDIATQIKCFTRHCNKRNNHWASQSCNNEKLDEFNRASDWNSLGVMIMERYLETGSERSRNGYPVRLLNEAMSHFSNASEAANHECWSAALNWAILLTKLGEYSVANEKYELAASLSPNVEQKAIVHVFWGLNEELRVDSSLALEHYDLVRTLDSQVEMDYWGVATTKENRQMLRTDYGPKETPPALMDFLLYKHFGRVSIAQYALIQPYTQDFFITNRYVVLRDILPPFVLQTLDTCFQNIIRSGILKMRDYQSDRYVTYNDRCSRFIHYQLTELIRDTVVHNVRPSSTYFGGYKSGATLAPHTDRQTCEFTVSLNIHQNPPDKPWTLSMGKIPIFVRNPDWKGARADQPPESETVNADLLPGDSLLFMGRHLVHFRATPLPEGHSTNQVFLHYVQENFDGELT